MAFVCLLLYIVPTFGQNSATSDIRGTVTDPTGAAVIGVEVTIHEIRTGVTKRLETNGAGLYDAVSILPGTYAVTFSKPGFKKVVNSDITLDTGAITLNATLVIGANSETVSVDAEEVQLKTENAEQSATLKAETMTELPNVGLSWTNFTQTLPGVSGTGTSVSVNGNMRYQGNWLSDGGTITHPQSADPFTGVQETISEVKIDTSNFGAQYGSGGAIFNQITKSGTNSFHGAVYEYVQNDFFNATTYFASAVPNLRFNNWGGSIGGPVLKNKLFFYFNYDRTHNTSTSYRYATYPTQQMRDGDFSSAVFTPIYDPATYSGGTRQAFAGNVIPKSRLDPVAVAIQSYMPMPNLPGTTNNWHGALTSINPNNRYFGRFDYNISEKNRLTGTTFVTTNDSFNPSPDCPMDCQNNNGRFYLAQLTDVWTLSPRVVNEFRMAYLGQGNQFSPPNLNQGYPSKIGLAYAKADIFPNITISGSTGFGGTSIGSGANSHINQNSYEPSDVVTFVSGKHILTFGGTLPMLQSNTSPWGNIVSGNFTFAGYYTQKNPYASGSGQSYADFLLGQAQSWSATNTPTIYLRSKIPQVFLQDDWKPFPHLTLNLGLRYQHQGGWSETQNRLGLFDPALTNPVTNTLGAIWFAGNNGRSKIQNGVNSFLPRVGFSWAANRSIVVRAGYGRYAYLWSGDLYGSGGRSLGAGSTGSMSDSNQINPVVLLSATNPTLNYTAPTRNPGGYNGQSVNYYPVDTPVSIVDQYSLSIQKLLADGLVWQVAYVGSHATHLSFPVNINQVPQAQLGPGNAQARRPYPQFLNINGDNYNASSNYNSLQTYVEKSFHNGLTYNVNYTYSRLLDNQDSSGWGGQAGTQAYQSSYDPGANYGPSNYDITHMLKGYAVYRLPFGAGQQWLNRSRLWDIPFGGWQLSSVVNIQSGTPFTALVGTANQTGAQGGNWFPNVVGNPHLNNPTVQQWFNPSAFAIPAAYTFGNARRNSLRGPRFTTVNLSVGKNFSLRKDSPLNLQVRMDAFNAFNHTVFANPNANIGTPSAGTITSTQISGRVLQLGARLAF
ncbi:TonB-dependent receptor [Edaphobacter flagellatus]|uniref:TonB-dependent receptor n=1 Tax=Edaphobacter flagellatus TaxID=1933044 RepID=UPI0021B2B6B9|nr:TonB-dependent receptor [Edaphobacter flagellatus]